MPTDEEKRAMVEKNQPDKKKNSLQVIDQYFDADAIKGRFNEIVGTARSGAYIASALTAVANSEKLQECSPQSIYLAAIQAATMRLSCDPSLGQAYLVPYKGYAKFIIGYKGLHDVAVRTGFYKYINTSPIYKGETCDMNRISGFHSIGGHQENDEIIGWLAAFQLNEKGGGYGKTLYMTLPQIHAHAKQYSPSYTFDSSPWQNPKFVHEMERKTVLRLLLRKWGYMDPADIQQLKQNEADEVIDVESIPEEYLPDKAITKK